MGGGKTRKVEAAYLLEATEKHKLYYPGREPEVFEEKFRRYYKTGREALKQADNLLKFRGASSVKITELSTGKSKTLKLGPTEYPLEIRNLLGGK